MLFISTSGYPIAYRHNHLRSKKIHLLVKTRDVKVPQMIIVFLNRGYMLKSFFIEPNSKIIPGQHLNYHHYILFYQPNNILINLIYFATISKEGLMLFINKNNIFF